MLWDTEVELAHSHVNKRKFSIDSWTLKKEFYGELYGTYNPETMAIRQNYTLKLITTEIYFKLLASNSYAFSMKISFHSKQLAAVLSIGGHCRGQHLHSSPGILLKCRFWVRKLQVRPEILHLSQALRQISASLGTTF